MNKDNCVWIKTGTSILEDLYETACGFEADIEFGGHPSELGWEYCPSCGKKIEIKEEEVS